MHRFAVIAIIALMFAAAAAAAQPPEAPQTSLEQKLDALDETDARLAKIEQQLQAVPTADAPALQKEKESLKQRQIALLREIAAAIGEPDPLPGQGAATGKDIREAAHRLLQKQLEQRQRLDEALLENNALRSQGN